MKEGESGYKESKGNRQIQKVTEGVNKVTEVNKGTAEYRRKKVTGKRLQICSGDFSKEGVLGMFSLYNKGTHDSDDIPSCITPSTTKGRNSRKRKEKIASGVHNLYAKKLWTWCHKKLVGGCIPSLLPSLSSFL